MDLLPDGLLLLLFLELLELFLQLLLLYFGSHYDWGCGGEACGVVLGNRVGENSSRTTSFPECFRQFRNGKFRVSALGFHKAFGSVGTVCCSNGLL